MPGYIVVQLGGACLAAWFVQAVINVSASYGSNYPAHGYTSLDAFWMETILTLGLVSVILGTASGAQNLGMFGAALRCRRLHCIGRPVGEPHFRHVDEPGAHIRPRLVSADFTAYWVYVAGPLLGAALAVAFAFVLRGRGGGRAGSGRPGSAIHRSSQAGPSVGAQLGAKEEAAHALPMNLEVVGQALSSLDKGAAPALHRQGPRTGSAVARPELTEPGVELPPG